MNLQWDTQTSTKCSINSRDGLQRVTSEAKPYRIEGCCRGQCWRLLPTFSSPSWLWLQSSGQSWQRKSLGKTRKAKGHCAQGKGHGALGEGLPETELPKETSTRAFHFGGQWWKRIQCPQSDKLENTFWKGNNYTLWVGMQINSAPMVSSLEVSQRTKNRITVSLSNRTGYLPKGIALPGSISKGIEITGYIPK